MNVPIDSKAPGALPYMRLDSKHPRFSNNYKVHREPSPLTLLESPPSSSIGHRVKM
jgi:hypothetical protein